jgi:hypothetical protein
LHGPYVLQRTRGDDRVLIVVDDILMTGQGTPGRHRRALAWFRLDRRRPNRRLRRRGRPHLGRRLSGNRQWLSFVRC